MRLTMIRVPITAKDSAACHGACCTKQCIAPVTPLTSPLLEPQQSRLSHEFGSEVARHQAPETRARKQTKKAPLSS